MLILMEIFWMGSVGSFVDRQPARQKYGRTARYDKTFYNHFRKRLINAR
jgi:hypothetical protein